jgi:HAD superfamily hydrolase (TIGR01490 family)
MPLHEADELTLDAPFLLEFLLSLAIFDLDNTLIGGDSDHLWGEFLVEQGRVDGETYRACNDQFYRDYQNGTLDIQAYLAFALAPLQGQCPEELNELHNIFMAHKIHPIRLPKADDLIAVHRQRGDTLLIITATNRFVTGPIAQWLNIRHLLASEPEIIDGLYSGRATGIACFQQGKVERLHQWLEEQGETLKGSYFYSDSANDLPLLQLVDHPVAVDPDQRLRAFAETNQIPIISLR